MNRETIIEKIEEVLELLKNSSSFDLELKARMVSVLPALRKRLEGVDINFITTNTLNVISLNLANMIPVINKYDVKSIGEIKIFLDNIVDMLPFLRSNMISSNHESVEGNAIMNKDIDAKQRAAMIGTLAESYSVASKKSERLVRFWGMLFFYFALFAVAFVIFRLFTITIMNNINDLIQYFFLTMPVTGFLVWIALYASSRRSEVMRLKQEYDHKVTVAESFLWFKDQFSDINDKEVLTEFYKSTIQNIHYNPSYTLDKKHRDHLPIETIIEKVIDKLPIEKIATKVVDKLSKI